MEEVIALLVAPKIHVTNTEANVCITWGQGQTFFQAFSAFFDFMDSIVVVVTEEHIAADTELVVYWPIDRWELHKVVDFEQVTRC